MSIPESDFSTLGAFAVELARMGHQDFQQRFDHPFLVRLDDADTHQISSFETGLMSRAGADASGAPLELIGGHHVDGSSEVYPVAKRAEGAFESIIGIGRVRSADICLPLAGISKYHAYLAPSGDDFTFADADSKNGTFLNGDRLAAKRPQPLTNGDVLGLGPYRLLYLNAAAFREAVAALA